MHFGLSITCSARVCVAISLELHSANSGRSNCASQKLAGPQTERAGVHGMEDEESKLTQAHNEVLDQDVLFSSLPPSFKQKLIPVN